MKKKHTKRKTDPEELAKIRRAVETYRKMLQYKRGEYPAHYPVPALIRCRWCGSDYSVCDYNKTGEWCPSMCFSDIGLY